MASVSAALLDESRWTALHASLTEDGTLDTVPGVLVDVVGRYASTTTQQVGALRTAWEQGRPAQAAEILHKMRGSGAMLGAVRVEQLTLAVEQQLGRTATPEALRLLAELERACAETAAALQARLASAQGRSRTN